MLAVFENGGEVLVCEVDKAGIPKTAGYFEEGTGRIRDEMDLTLVEAPIMITGGSLKAEPERTIEEF